METTENIFDDEDLGHESRYRTMSAFGRKSSVPTLFMKRLKRICLPKTPINNPLIENVDKGLDYYWQGRKFLLAGRIEDVKLHVPFRPITYNSKFKEMMKRVIGKLEHQKTGSYGIFLAPWNIKKDYGEELWREKSAQPEDAARPEPAEPERSDYLWILYHERRLPVYIVVDVSPEANSIVCAASWQGAIREKPPRDDYTAEDLLNGMERIPPIVPFVTPLDNYELVGYYTPSRAIKEIRENKLGDLLGKRFNL